MRAKQMTYETRLLEAKTETDGDRRLGRVHALVSVFGNVDWDGDRIIRGAFADDLKAWRERGDPIPWIWSHEWYDLDAHVGWVPPEVARETDRGLEVAALHDLEDPSSAKVYELLRQRRITNFSFAFDVLDEEDTEEETDRGWTGHVTELKQLKLYECGPCLVGANDQTDLLEVASRGLWTPHRAGRPGKSARQALLAAREAIDRALGPEPEPEPRELEKAAIAPHGTGTSEEAWDGPANEARLANDAGAATYRRAFAWVDPDGDPDTKASYRFIHHFVGENGNVGSASTRACTTGIAVLNGARGGTTIPSGDRSGVYAHLARHLRDADMEPPELATAEVAEDTARPPDELAALEALVVDVI